MKYAVTAASFLFLVACGGSNEPVNPFTPVVVVPATDTVSTPIAQNDTQTAAIEPVVQEVYVPPAPEPAPVQQPEPAPEPQPAPQPVRGECIDYDPVGDGYGHDGVGTCMLPVALVVTESQTEPPIIPEEPKYTMEEIQLWSGVWDCSVRNGGPSFALMELKDDLTIVMSDSSTGKWNPIENGFQITWDHNRQTTTHVRQNATRSVFSDDSMYAKCGPSDATFG